MIQIISFCSLIWRVACYLCRRTSGTSDRYGRLSLLFKRAIFVYDPLKTMIDYGKS